MDERCTSEGRIKTEAVLQEIEIGLEAAVTISGREYCCGEDAKLMVADRIFVSLSVK